MRKQFKFWLDSDKSIEQELIFIIDSFKRERMFSQCIRDGLMLIHSLRHRNVSVLLRMFPWVEDYFRMQYLSSMQTIQNVNDKIETLGMTVNEVELTINQVHRWSETIRALPAPAEQAALPAPSRSASSIKFSLDSLEDTLEVKTASSNADNRSNWNFAISSALAIFGNGNSLPDEVIEYGIRTNRLHAHQVTRAYQAAPQALPEPISASQGTPKQLPAGNGNAKQLAGGNVEFAAPTFDDDDLLSF